MSLYLVNLYFWLLSLYNKQKELIEYFTASNNLTPELFDKMVENFENYNNNSILIIVDVQRSFRSFFTEMYIHKLKEYCKQFTEVYQIFDNHHEGKNVDKDYLYDDNPDIPISDELYTFPNQKDIIEKRYNYDVNVDFYKKILDKETYKEAKEKEDNKTLKKGDLFKTTEGTAIVYIGNNHKWHHVS